MLFTDRISSACPENPFTVQDAPAGNANRLTVLTQPDANPRIFQGQTIDITVPSTTGGTAANPNTWDIVLNGGIIASAQNPLGWTVAFDTTPYRGIILGIDLNAPVANGYIVRVNGLPVTDGGQLITGNALFDVPGAPGSNAVQVQSIVFTPTQLVGGTSTSATVTLSGIAPAGGVAVTLRSDNATLVNLPPFILVPAGTSSVTFPVTTSTVPAPTTVFVLAAYNTNVSTLVTLIDTNGKPPAAPVLSATAGNAIVQLSWLPVPTANGYTVKRALSPAGPFVPLFTGFNGTGYVDRNLTNGTTYYYVVCASNLYGQSAASNIASATPYAGVAAAPILTPPAGTFRGSVSVTMACSNPTDAIIRYTLDGSQPTALSSAYMQGVPLVLTQTTTVTAQAFKTGYLPSALTTGGFVITVPHLVGLTIAPNTITTNAIGGTTLPSTGTVILDDFAPAGSPVLVTLAGGVAGVANIPANVIVPGGAKTATFPIDCYPVSTATLVTISGHVLSDSSDGQQAQLLLLPASTGTGGGTIFGPTIKVTAPKAGATFTTTIAAPVSIAIQAAATPTTGTTIKTVTFFADAVKIGDVSAPDANGFYAFTWTGASVGHP